MRVDFPMPGDESVRRAIETFLGKNQASAAWQDVLTVALRGLSFSDIEREVMLARRGAVIQDESLESALSRLVQSRSRTAASERTGPDRALANRGRNFAARRCMT